MMAITDILEGEQITINYVNLMETTPIRQAKLEDNWYFQVWPFDTILLYLRFFYMKNSIHFPEGQNHHPHMELHSPNF